MKMRKKFKSCFAVMTSAVCLSTALTGMTASALNITSTGVNKEGTSVVDLSQAVYTVPDTEINLVTANMAFEQDLKHYSYDETNKRDNKKSVGFSLSFSEDMTQIQLTITNRVICDSILGEMYRSGNRKIFAEVHNYSSSMSTLMGGMYIPITIKSTDGIHFTPVCEESWKSVVPVNFLLFANESMTPRDDEFFALVDSHNVRISSYFTCTKNCKMTSYDGAPIYYINSSAELLISMDTLSKYKLKKFKIDSTGRGFSDTKVYDLDMVYIPPTYTYGSWIPGDDEIDSASGYKKPSSTVSGGHAILMNPDYSKSCTAMFSIKDAVSQQTETFDMSAFKTNHVYIPGYTISDKDYGYSFLGLSNAYSTETIAEMIKMYGYTEYYNKLGITSPVTNLTVTTNSAVLPDYCMEDEVDVKSKLNEFGRTFMEFDSAKSFDTSSLYGDSRLLQDIFTTKDKYYTPFTIGTNEDGTYSIGADLKSDEVKSVVEQNTSGDYFVSFDSGKTMFITHTVDADDNYKLVQSGNPTDIREVSTKYIGVSNPVIQSVEKSEFDLSKPAVSVTASDTAVAKGTKLFLPDLTYELADETELVRLRLHSMNDINSIIDVMKTAETELTTNEVYYIYDSSYKTPLEAYEAGADFYTVADGDYDILLPTGEYKVSAILEASNKDASFFKQVDLGTITTDSRDVDLVKLASGEVENIAVVSPTVTVKVKKGEAMEDVDVSSYVSNAVKVGGYKSAALKKGTTQSMPMGITFKNGAFSGTPITDTNGEAVVTITANNGTTVDLTVAFDFGNETIVTTATTDSSATTTTVAKTTGSDEGSSTSDSDSSKTTNTDEGTSTTVSVGSETTVSSITETTVSGETETTVASESGTGSDMTSDSGSDSSTTTETTTSTTVSSSEVEGTVLYGDVNLDGDVDIADAVLLNKAIAGAVMLNEQAKKNADCHADGAIETNDSISLLQFLVRTIDTLPVTD